MRSNWRRRRLRRGHAASVRRSAWTSRPPHPLLKVRGGPVRPRPDWSYPASFSSVPIGMHSPKVVLALLPLALAGSAVLPASVTRIAVGANPCGNTFAFGSIWVAAAGSDTLVRVDPKRNKPIGRVRVGRSPCGVASGAGSVWVEDFGAARIERVNPKTMKVVARIAAGRHVWDVLFAAGAAWASNHDDGTVERIDPRTNRVVARIATGGNPANMTFAAGAVWVGSNSGDAVFRIDPGTNAFSTVHLGQDAPASITSDGVSLWVSNRNDSTVTRYDLGSGTVVATIPVGRGPVVSAIAADGSRARPERDRRHALAHRPRDEHRRTGDPAPRCAADRPILARRPLGRRQPRRLALPHPPSLRQSVLRSFYRRNGGAPRRLIERLVWFQVVPRRSESHTWVNFKGGWPVARFN